MSNTPQLDKAHPHQFSNVSEGVQHLEPIQSQKLEESFAKWKKAAKRADSVQARERMWLIFSMLRHTGARLGEILSLDDATAFDPQGPFVHLGKNGRIRKVPLPDELYSEIMSVLEGPFGCGLRGTFFHVDPGYFRRICYARGKDCGLSKEQVCPKSIRNTRAVEMLRSGVPITIVKKVLGQSSLDLTANFQQFSDGDMHSIVRKAHASIRNQTSARNAFAGHIIKVSNDGIMSEVVLETRSGIEISAVITTDSLRNLKLSEGTPVVATIKAPLVNVLKPGNEQCGSARNRLSATVLRINSSPVLSEITGRLSNGSEVCALVSAQSTETLALKSGDKVEYWFKALSVVLNTIQL